MLRYAWFNMSKFYMDSKVISICKNSCSIPTTISARILKNI